jgi:hypothetical protein
VTVVANLHAADEQEAKDKLAALVQAHGFEVIEDTPGAPLAYRDAFEAEEGTEPSDPPYPVQRRRPVDYDQMQWPSTNPPA